MVIQPIIDWAEAWWEGTVEQEEMTAAWRYAVKAVGVAARPNAVIAGGAGTFVASLRRLGWRTPSPDSVITAKGEILFFGDGNPPEAAHAVDPRALRRWLTDEYEAVVLTVGREEGYTMGARHSKRDQQKSGDGRGSTWLKA